MELRFNWQQEAVQQLTDIQKNVIVIGHKESRDVELAAVAYGISKALVKNMSLVLNADFSIIREKL